MIGELARKWTRGMVDSLAILVGRTGVTPNGLSVLGFLVMAGVGYLLASGHWRIGAVLIVLAGSFDALDGALARATNRVTAFGAFLDSNLDRFAEVVLYLGLLYFYAQRGAQEEIVLVYLTLAGSLLVSYARARAEGIGVECRVGLFTRFERIAVLLLGLLFAQMRLALWVLAVLASLTVVQRLVHVWRVTGAQR